MENPNILIITIDALRPDRLGCYGNPKNLTPNIDRLASKGVCFKQAITGGSWTQAAFPVLLTSTYASMYGGCIGQLAAERPSPVEALAAAGYATGGFSTSPLLSKEYSYNRGFQYFPNLIPDEVDPPLRKIKGGQKLLRSPFFHRISNLAGFNSRPARLYISADELTRNVCNWLDGVQNPFFAWVHYMDVHWPYHIEKRLEKPNDIAQAWRDLSHLHSVAWKGKPLSEPQKDRYVHLYEEAVSYTDFWIGKLLDYLETSGESERTIVILLSDHGEEFLEHDRWGHRESNLHDELLHVPLVILLPNGPRGFEIIQQVRTLDIMPTVLDLSKQTLLEGMLGTSLLPLISGDPNGYKPEFSISEMPREDWHRVAVRNGNYKYIWDSQHPESPLLFDLQVDPGEKHNLNPSSNQIIDELHSQVKNVLELKEQTAPRVQSLVPELDENVLDRLRGLGYLE
jgi:arylsulfatase A-like enzyme